MKRTMRLPLSACDVDVRLWGSGNERARLNKDISCETPPRFARLYDPGGREGEQEKHRPRCVGGGGADGRAERPASRADLYRLRDRNSDALHSFMCLVRPSSVSGGRGRPSLPTSRPLLFLFLSWRNCFYAPPFRFPVRLLRLPRNFRQGKKKSRCGKYKRAPEKRRCAGVMTSSEQERRHLPSFLG